MKKEHTITAISRLNNYSFIVAAICYLILAAGCILWGMWEAGKYFIHLIFEAAK